MHFWWNINKVFSYNAPLLDQHISIIDCTLYKNKHSFDTLYITGLPTPPPSLNPPPTASEAGVSPSMPPLAAALYGSPLWPTFCVQNAFLHYQRLAAEAQQLGLTKLTPQVISPTPPPPDGKEDHELKSSPSIEDQGRDRIFGASVRPLDLCTKRPTPSLLINNNLHNSLETKLRPASRTASTKAIWSPASSCEEENRHQELTCFACQRSFNSPTKLELHLRKVHSPNSSTSGILTGSGSKIGTTTTPSVTSTRRERIFKVSHFFLFSRKK